LTEALVARVARAIAASSRLSSSDLVPRAEAVDRDRELLDDLISGALPSGFVRLWRQQRCIVVPGHFARRPGFEEAARRSADRGWPVRVRISGGTAVAQHPGILNISLFRCGGPDMQQAYSTLVSLIACALGQFGLAVTAGPIVGASCDGRFNLCWRGRKLAGTAAALRIRGGRYFTLVHASLAIEADLAEDLAAVAAFETELGMEVAYRIDAHGSVRCALDAADHLPLRSAGRQANALRL